MNVSESQRPSTSQNTKSGNASESYDNIRENRDVSVEDERRQILEWLSPLSPALRHRDIGRSRVEGVGGWFLQTNEFTNWNTGEGGVVSPVLFGCGHPGAGKTHLSALVIETLLVRSDRRQVAVACLYCDFYSHKDQSVAHMLGAILKQVAGGMESIPEEIEAAFQGSQADPDGRELDSDEMIMLLISSFRTLQRSYVCIDALDEFPVAHRRDFFKALAQIMRESPRTRLFLTGRPHIWGEIERCFTGSVKIWIKPTEEDVKEYLVMRLRNDARPEAMDQDLREEILGTIPERVSPVFLLASLGVNAILSQSTISRRRRTLRLGANGQELCGAYAATIDRIMAQDGNKRKLGIGVLKWISRSERPLRAEELRHALAIERNSTEFDPHKVPEIGVLLSYCLGLVTLDEEGSRVRLIHVTLQEYLTRDPHLFRRAHSEMAEICLTYLNFPSVKALPPGLAASPPQTPFLEYASCYWGTHARKELTQRTKSLALQLLDRYDHHVSAKLLLVNQGVWPELLDHGDLSATSGFTGLHAAAYFGVAEIATALIKSWGWDVNGKDCVGLTPLLWAVTNNSEGVCKVLLELGDVDPNIAARGVGAPLSKACADGHEGIVKLLLERKEVNPNSPDNYGQSPLRMVARDGHEGIVKLLLGREEANPDLSDKNGQTPLWGAAMNGHEDIVKLLLRRNEVNPDSPDRLGKTPLWCAAMRGHEGIVKLLLERKEVNPSSTDEYDTKSSDNCYGRTPLWGAAWNGYEGIVRLLLQRKEVNPDSSDSCHGHTPLWEAVWNGHEGVVKLLLERKGVNPNSSDNYGQSPLWIAARDGHAGIVKLLLERSEVNPGSREGYLSPLWIAAQNGHEGIVKLLLERNEVNPGSPEGCQSPLWIAAQNGHEGIVKLLLERKEANPDSSSFGNYGQTPLRAAARNGHEGIVKLLLERKEVNPNSSDKNGQTPLWAAAMHGHAGIVKLLLERKEVNPDSRDYCYGYTPLWGASRGGHEGVVKLLLERKEVNPDLADRDWQTPLQAAARNGHTNIVKLLLERKEINPGQPNSCGYAPPPLATKSGHQGVVKPIPEQPRANLETLAARTKETRSLVPRSSDKTLAQIVITDLPNDHSLKRKSHTLGGGFWDPETVERKRLQYAYESYGR